jgi:N-acylneuraminate cytidylyltransferase
MDFCGKPLIAWSIEQAKASQYIEDVYVSSDDDEILRVAAGYGAIKIKRPQELATDSSLSEPALIHALGNMGNPDIIVFLQATSPVRETEDIDDAITQFLMSGKDSLFSVSTSHEENGSIYIFKSDKFNECKNRKAGCTAVYVMPQWKSKEIDYPEDIGVCEHYMGLL